MSSWEMVVALGGVLAAAVVAGAAARSRVVSSQRVAIAPHELSFYEAALLAGGRRRVADTALAYLVWAGVIEVRERTMRLVLRAPPRSQHPLAPVEEALLSSITMEGVAPALPMARAREAAGWVEHELVGLVVPARARAGVLGVMIVPAVLAAVVAAVWMLGEAVAGRDLGFVPVIPAIAAAVALVAWIDRPLVTREGERVLEELGRQFSDQDLEVAVSGVTSVPIERGLYLVALYGRRAMTGGLSGLRKLLGPAHG